MMRVVFIPISLLVFLVYTPGYSQFEDATADYSVRQTHVNQAFLGGGAAFLDFNNDGWEDMVLTGGSEPDKLFLNIQGESFQEMEQPFIRFSGTDISSAVVSGDLNNDGCIDLLITNYSRNGYDLLYQNNCDGTFTLIDYLDGLSSVTNSIGATLFDFNLDGLLDIYIIGHVQESIFIRDDENKIIGYDHVCGKNKLYINQGDFEFEDQTDTFNAEGLGCSLAVTVVPRPDTVGFGILIANDFGPFLVPNEFLVLENNHLEDLAPRYNLDKAIYGMGIGVGDIDNDSDLDLYITNLGENLLHVNDGTHYVEKQMEWGVQNTNAPDGRLTTGWGTFFTDCDNDTDIDLYVANGTIQSPEFIGGTFIDPNRFYINDASAQLFVETDESFGISKLGANINRGAAKSDFDNDGDEDIVTAYINFIATTSEDLEYKIHKNVGIHNNNFLKIDLQPSRNAPGGFGALIKVYIDGSEYIKYKYSGGTHASQNSQIIHFGLGAATMVDSIEVRWRDQTTSKYYNISSDQVIRLGDESDNVEILGCTDPDSDNYNANADVSWGCKYQNTTTSIFDESTVNAFNLFPNPAYNGSSIRITLEFKSYQKQVQIGIFDLLGTRLTSSDVDVYGKELISDISIDALPAGIYIVNVTDDSGFASQRFIKL